MLDVSKIEILLSSAAILTVTTESLAANGFLKKEATATLYYSHHQRTSPRMCAHSLRTMPS
jgi:hypothetical protein